MLYAGQASKPKGQRWGAKKCVDQKDKEERLEKRRIENEAVELLSKQENSSDKMNGDQLMKLLTWHEYPKPELRKIRVPIMKQTWEEIKASRKPAPQFKDWEDKEQG